MNNTLVFLATYRHNPITLLTAANMAHEHGADFIFSRDNPHTGNEAGLNILHQYKRAQRLAAGYDYIMTIEDDMIVPYYALTLLMDALRTCKADAAYGVYHFRRLSLTGNPVTKDSGVSISAKEWTRAYKAKAIIECGGIGYGCTLFRADVFAQVPLETRNGSGGDSDTHLGEWMRKQGHKQVAHFGVQCGHIRHDGSVLYVGDKPDNPLVHGELKRTLVNVRVLVSFAYHTYDNVQRFAFEGDELPIDSELADIYAPVGIVEIIK